MSRRVLINRWLVQNTYQFLMLEQLPRQVASDTPSNIEKTPVFNSYWIQKLSCGVSSAIKNEWFVLSQPIANWTKTSRFEIRCRSSRLQELSQRVVTRLVRPGPRSFEICQTSQKGGSTGQNRRVTRSQHDDSSATRSRQMPGQLFAIGRIDDATFGDDCRDQFGGR